jgi:hypothetical protein
VAISRHGSVVTILRGGAAEKFLNRVHIGDSQQTMARAAGNYKRGNERG